MAKQPRRHHYVPKFYLAGFTATGSVDGSLHVVDIEHEKQYASAPNATAYERDYHAVDLGSDRMVVEKKLAECEGTWATALRTALEHKALPGDDSLGDLLAFVAFMAVRIPRFRTETSDFIDRTSKAELRATFATTEGRQQFRSVIDQHLKTLSASDRNSVQQHLDSDPYLDQMAEYAGGEQYTVSPDQTWSVQTMVRMAIALLPVLGKRRWALRPVADDAPDLICSDSPVCLTWANPVVGHDAPGFGSQNTLITVPLDKRLLLASMFEEFPQTESLTSVDVARMNSRTAMFASHLYSPGPEFIWLMEDGCVGNAEAFISHIGTGSVNR